MTTWQRNSTIIATLNLPFCVHNTNKDIAVALTPSENLDNCFLYVDEDFLGIIQGKLSTEVSYREIGIYSLTPSCFLGNLTASTGYTINLRINFPNTFLGEQIVPIYLGYGDDVVFFDADEQNPWENLTDGENSWYDNDSQLFFGWSS